MCVCVLKGVGTRRTDLWGGEKGGRGQPVKTSKVKTKLQNTENINMYIWTSETPQGENDAMGKGEEGWDQA